MRKSRPKVGVRAQISEGDMRALRLWQSLRQIPTEAKAARELLLLELTREEETSQKNLEPSIGG